MEPLMINERPSYPPGSFTPLLARYPALGCWAICSTVSGAKNGVARRIDEFADSVRRVVERFNGSGSQVKANKGEVITFFVWF